MANGVGTRVYVETEDGPAYPHAPDLITAAMPLVDVTDPRTNVTQKLPAHLAAKADLDENGKVPTGQINVASEDEAKAGTGTRPLTSERGKAQLAALLGSTAVAAKAFTGTGNAAPEPSVPLSVEDILAQTVRPEQMGVDKTGTENAGPILSRTLTKAMLTGRPTYIDKGRYLIKTTMGVALIGSLQVYCHPEAVFVADATLNDKMAFLSASRSSGLSAATVHWAGGIFDGTALANSPAGKAYDLLTISENVEDVVIERAKFLHSGNAASQGLGLPVVINGGSDYTTATINIGAPDQPNGIQAIGTAIISGGEITQWRFYKAGTTNVPTNGRGYSSLPSITVTGDGTGASLSASLVSDYRTAGGDSSLFLVGRRITVRECYFQGSWDSAIYASGTRDQSFGEALTVTGNCFQMAAGPMVAKRNFKRIIVTGNHCYKCRTGFSTGIADATLVPGSTLVVSNNIFKFTPFGDCVKFQASPNSVCVGNIVEDVGYDLDGFGIANIGAYIASGAPGGTFIGNVARMKDWVSTSGMKAFFCSPFTQNATTYNSTGCTFTGNVSEGFATGFIEANTDQDNNTYGFNKVVGAKVALYNVVGPNSTIVRGDAGVVETIAGTAKIKGLRITGTDAAAVVNFPGTVGVIAIPAGGTILYGGPAGSEAFRATGVTTPANCFQFVNAAAGAGPSLTARGSDADVPARFGAKGAASVVMLSPTQLPAFTFATLPSVTTYAGSQVRVSDRNNRTAVSDGANWRYGDNSIAT